MILQPSNFYKVEFTNICSAGRTGKKSQKYFDLSTFNYNLYDSNPCSSLGVMNFQKWELFSGSPGTFWPLFCQ